MRNLLHDLKYALRVFFKTPGFSLTLTLILAIGIGGTTTIFTVLYGVVLRPLPLTDPERLVFISVPKPPRGESLDWWNQGQTFTSLCEYQAGGINLAEGDFPQRISAAMVSSGFFSVFEVLPVLGRPFIPDDESPGQNNIVILSAALWRTKFASDPNIIGKGIVLNNLTYTVVGVMPIDFSYPGRTEMWLPRATDRTSVILGDDEQTDMPLSLKSSIIGRLAKGISVADAKSQIQTLFERLKELSAKSRIQVGDAINLIPLQELYVKDSRAALWALFGAVGLLLILACANATNLILIRAAARQKEIAIRLCLGASSLRVIQQLLTEAILLAVVSGSAGILFAYFGLEIIRTQISENIPRLSTVHLNGVVLNFSLGLSLLVSIIVSLAPILQLRSINFAETLKESGSKTSIGLHRHVRNAIVVVEIAVSFILLVGAGLMIQSFFHLTNVAPGFDANNVLTMQISLPKAKYGELPTPKTIGQTIKDEAGNPPLSAVNKTVTSPSEVKTPTPYLVENFYHNLLEKTEQLPGIVAVGGVSQLPLSHSRGMKLSLTISGKDGGLALLYTIVGNYFQAMGIPLIQGRSFTEADKQGSPKVVIINRSLANLFWNGENAIGQQITIAGESQAREIVGIVGDVKQSGLIKEMEPQFYLPYLQPLNDKQPPLEIVFVAKTSIDPDKMVGSLRNQIVSVDRNLPVFRIKTLERVISDSTTAYRFRGFLSGVFAVIALVLAVFGVYSVVAYSVALRTQEIGIRMALGAMPKQILQMILREGIWLSAIGIVVGILASFGLSRFISSLLYGVQAVDIFTFILSVFMLLIGALFACIWPAFIGSKMEPAKALRYE